MPSGTLGARLKHLLPDQSIPLINAESILPLLRGEAKLYERMTVAWKVKR